MSKWVIKVAEVMFFGGVLLLVASMASFIFFEFLEDPSDAAWAGIVCSLISMGAGYLIAYNAKD